MTSDEIRMAEGDTISLRHFSHSGFFRHSTFGIRHLVNLMRILSGIQPSGVLHIGNYFGMMRPAIALQAEGEALLFHCRIPRADQRPRSGGAA